MGDDNDNRAICARVGGMDPAGRHDSLTRASLYLILSRGLCRRPPLDVVRGALAGGVGIVQIREKALSDVDLIEWVLEVRRVAEPFGALVIVNDRPDIAVLADADGAHLGQDDLTPEMARHWVGDDRLLGLSTHDRPQVEAAHLSCADYLGFGPIFATSTKQLSGLGVPSIDSTFATTKPVFCIGGITLDNLPMLLAVGVNRVAVSSALCGAEDPESTAAELMNRLRRGAI